MMKNRRKKVLIMYSPGLVQKMVELPIYIYTYIHIHTYIHTFKCCIWNKHKSRRYVLDLGDTFSVY